MLSKLVSIKNVGRFRNSAAGGDTQLRRCSFIVGPNGFGKTTICAILRSLKSGDPALVVGRKTLGVSAAPVIDILTNAGMSRFDGSAWSTVHPDIAVFDGQFVADNIHSSEVVDVEHKRNLYRVIIGDDGVRLAEEDAALAAESRAKTSDVTAAVRALNPHLPSGMKVAAYVALAAVADIDVQIAEQEKKVASIADAATISARAGLLGALLRIPVVLEIPDQRGREVTHGLVACVNRHVGTEEVERCAMRKARRLLAALTTPEDVSRSTTSKSALSIASGGTI